MQAIIASNTQRQRHFNAEQRAEWIALYRSTQLPREQFAQQNGLKLGTFQRWLREERQRSSPSTAASAFQEVRLPSFLPNHAWVAEVLLPNGVVVRLGAATTPSWMQSVLQVLRKAC
jgi:transposase-like protein